MERLRWDEPRAYRRAKYRAEGVDLPSVAKGVAAIFFGILALAAFARLNPAPDARLPGWGVVVLVALGAALAFGVGLPALTRYAAVALVIVGGKGVNHNRMIGASAQVRFWPWGAFRAYRIADERVGSQTFRTLGLFDENGERLRVALAPSVSEAELRRILDGYLADSGR